MNQQADPNQLNSSIQPNQPKQPKQPNQANPSSPAAQGNRMQSEPAKTSITPPPVKRITGTPSTRPTKSPRQPQAAPRLSIGRRLSGGLLLLIFGLLFVGAVFILYQSSTPVRYSLTEGQVSDQNVILTRPVINRAKTQERAQRAAAQVSDVLKRSAEIAKANVDEVEQLIATLKTHREAYLASQLNETDPAAIKAVERDLAWHPSADQIEKLTDQTLQELNQTLKTPLVGADLNPLFEMVPSTFTLVSDHLSRLTTLTTQEALSRTTRDRLLHDQVQGLIESNPQYTPEYQLIEGLLMKFIQPNLVYDEEGTRLAREEAARQVSNSPVLIEKGTQVLSAGEKVTAEHYQILKDAELLKTSRVDWSTLLGSILALTLLVLLSLAYLYKRRKKSLFSEEKKVLSVLVTLGVPFIFTAYTVNYSPLAVPVYFASILLTAYYGVKTALILTTGLTLLVFPMTYMNFHFLFCALFGVLVSALITDGFTNRDKYAFVIAGTALAPALASIALDFLLRTPVSTLLLNAGILASVGALSAVASVGVMPLYEIFLDAVSPLRLIELSNPNQPLLKRMLLEAPGTAQHSNMVANLSEVAADAIGADSLLARVGALYHDIGKMKNPAYFTENQDGENPHDYLTPQESARIIFAHVTDGVQMARDHHLPEEFTHFIVEHHGDTVLASIYAKACAQAEAQGLPQPDPKDYTYPGQIPQSKETGIVMIADSVEAAMKSTGYKDLERAEGLIRKIVKGKNDQDQLVDSGLSYQEVEQVIRAFLQVYAGQFHERIPYPDANPIRKTSL